jgi:LmbE family N-acetylglucosaminyl deacetylase
VIREDRGALRAARLATAAEVERFGPDIIITFAPGGGSGHPDHRLVGDLTTEIVLARADDRIRLFHAGWAQNAGAIYNQAGLGLSVHHDDAFDVVFSHTPEDEAVAAAALRCYTSAFTPEEIDGYIALEKADQGDRRGFEVTVKARSISEQRRSRGCGLGVLLVSGSSGEGIAQNGGLSRLSSRAALISR